MKYSSDPIFGKRERIPLRRPSVPAKPKSKKAFVLGALAAIVIASVMLWASHDDDRRTGELGEGFTGSVTRPTQPATPGFGAALPRP